MIIARTERTLNPVPINANNDRRATTVEAIAMVERRLEASPESSSPVKLLGCVSFQAESNNDPLVFSNCSLLAIVRAFSFVCVDKKPYSP